jgi:hypothetical protein
MGNSQPIKILTTYVSFLKPKQLIDPFILQMQAGRRGEGEADRV